jgi:hypothetical protein
MRKGSVMASGKYVEEHHHHSTDNGQSSLDERPRLLSDDRRDGKSEGNKEREFHARLKTRRRGRGGRGERE